MMVPREAKRVASSARRSRARIGVDRRRRRSGPRRRGSRRGSSSWPSRFASPFARVVLVAVGDEVGERHAVVGGDEADAAGGGGRIDVRGAGDGGAERAQHVGVAAPEPPHPVAVAVVPFQPGRRGSCRAGSRRGRRPRARRSGSGRRASGIGGDLAAGVARLGVEAVRGAAEDRGEVEAEAVDAGLADEMAQGVEDQAAGGGVVAGQRVAGAGVVDEAAVRRRGGSRRGRRGRAGRGWGRGRRPRRCG